MTRLPPNYAARCAECRALLARLDDPEFPTPAEHDLAELTLAAPPESAQAELPLQGAA